MAHERHETCKGARWTKTPLKRPLLLRCFKDPVQLIIFHERLCHGLEGLDVLSRLGSREGRSHPAEAKRKLETLDFPKPEA